MTRVEDVLGDGGSLASLSTWERRPQQLEMARAVEAALAEETPLFVEAGTGTGKTLAYLVPALLSGKRVVVSTGTRHLQEQIHRKDIPLLREHLPPFESAVLKGISNYVCRRRLASLGDTDDADLVRIADWATTTTVGDRSELDAVADDSPAWRQVTTTPEARLGPRCPFFERCFVTQARRAASKAQLVIVNHHLFFADLALRAAFPGAQVLPPYEAVIFDEAHQVEDVATEHFGVGVSTVRLLGLLRDARAALEEKAGAKGTGGMLVNLEARGDELFRALRGRLAPLVAETSERLATPEDLFTGPIREAWFKLDAALEELAARAARDEGDEDAAAVSRRANALRADLAVVAEPGRDGKRVHWAELRGRSVFLHASPVDVGPFLRRHLAESVPAVFTSATLASAGRFDYLRARLGYDDQALCADTRAIGSPFDYQKQALLYLPRDLPSPKEPGFDEAALARIVELCDLTKGRAFLLFTSHRALRRAARELPGRLAYPLLVQGDAAPATLVERFRARPGSVLLATSGFWEGVDVPGEALSLVVLEKLPFAAPDDPLTAARARGVEARGQDPFAQYHLPRATLALKQGFGRLIRRRDDRGIVAILDHRIVTKGYGQTFLASLPPVARTSSLEQVRRWW